MKQFARWSLFVVALVAFASVATNASAHCQMPCGIYDHHARIHTIREDVATLEKAVAQIRDLAGKTDAQSQNQLVRWVNTKEEHATAIQNTVSEYFLTQVVKPADPKDEAAYGAYLKTLADHHAVLVAAMKVKQTVDPAAVDALKKAVDQLETYYPGN